MYYVQFEEKQWSACQRCSLVSQLYFLIASKLCIQIPSPHYATISKRVLILRQYIPQLALSGLDKTHLGNVKYS